jgi:flagellum-specific peptidoglycan hydrolase FlgJ
LAARTSFLILTYFIVSENLFGLKKGIQALSGSSVYIDTPESGSLGRLKHLTIAG